MKRKRECFFFYYFCWLKETAGFVHRPTPGTHLMLILIPILMPKGGHKEALRATHYGGDCLRVTLISALVSLSCILISCMQGIAYDLINLPLMNFIILNKTVTTWRHTSPEVNYQPKVFEHSLLVHPYALICIFFNYLRRFFM